MIVSNDWKQERALLVQRVKDMRAQGRCYICHDLATGEIFGNQNIAYEDKLFRLALDLYPQVRGQAILIYKPHREDISVLAGDEVRCIFQMCVRTVKTLKVALGAEKVYLTTMCDGNNSHLHFQLYPRRAGDPTGARLFHLERYPLTDKDLIIQSIRRAWSAEGKLGAKGFPVQGLHGKLVCLDTSDATP